jgi:hypothetical protein
VREVILEPVRQHSRKPEALRARIERYCAGPYAELFARSERPGWAAWGFEVGKYGGNGSAPPPACARMCRTLAEGREAVSRPGGRRGCRETEIGNCGEKAQQICALTKAHDL